MIAWTPMDRRERAILGACLYLGALFVSCMVMWWMALIGGNPFKIQNIGVIDRRGTASEPFRSGDVVGIRRQICSERDIGLEFYPGLQDKSGFYYPLPHGMFQMKSGCMTTTYAFVVPDIPPGQYTYISTVKYQNNLVGRDEESTFPPLIVTISGDK